MTPDSTSQSLCKHTLLRNCMMYLVQTRATRLDVLFLDLINWLVTKSDGQPG